MLAETLTKAEEIAHRLGGPMVDAAADAVQAVALIHIGIGSLILGGTAVAVWAVFHESATWDQEGDAGLRSFGRTVAIIFAAVVSLFVVPLCFNPTALVSAISGELGLALRVVRAVTGG